MQRGRGLPGKVERVTFEDVAADLIKLAMLGVYRRLRREACRSRLLLQIHDELVFEAPPEEIDTLAALVREEMNSAYEMSVPLVVDVKTGANWAQCEPWEE